jgi:hypothetical protein
MDIEERRAVTAFSMLLSPPQPKRHTVGGASPRIDARGLCIWDTSHVAWQWTVRSLLRLLVLTVLRPPGFVVPWVPGAPRRGVSPCAQ